MDYQNLLLTTSLIIAFCTVCDYVATPEEEEKNKEILEKWYNDLWNFSYTAAVKKINVQFLTSFDSIYGKKHLSIRCFKMSLLTTITSMAALLLFYLPINVIAFIFSSTEYFIGILYILIFNGLIDYISLLETRWVLGLSTKSPPRYIAFYILLDLTLTTLLICSPYVMLILSLTFVADDFLFEEKTFNEFWDISIKLLSKVYSLEGTKTELDNASPMLKVVFHSTYATSIIYYIFFLSFIGIKTLSLSKKRLMPMLNKIQESKHTYKTIGAILSAIIGLVEAGVAFVA